jgi:hypothetical protein
LQQNGRLPEGNYTFCIEVLDYPTGIVLSNTSCASAWIRLNDPPKIINPLCGAYIDPIQPLNIPFQWQLSNAISPNATLGTEFRLVLYELTEAQANPFTAIASGKVLPIYESNALTRNSFNYSPSEPTLDIGKTYVYQIKATDVGGRDLFKNNGLSESCWFHFGYPENAKNTLLAPEDNKAFKKTDPAYFRWQAPDRRLRNQPFVYEIKIVEVAEGQDLQQAMINNSVWYSKRTLQTFSDKGMDIVVDKKVRPAQNYAWQITTFSASQTVAKSEIRKFTGPPLVEYFYAGKHIVTVQRASSNDSLNFTGEGKVRTGYRDSTIFLFSGLKLKRVGAYWVLFSGVMEKALPDPKPISLSPINNANGTAHFYPKALRLSSSELSMQGEVQWALPHPVKSKAPAFVKSEVAWLNFDKYSLLGSARLSEQNNFELLEPYGFSLKLSPESDFLISNNQFDLRAQGTIEMPKKVKGKQTGAIIISFPRTTQLFYLEDLAFVMENDLAPLESVRAYIKPRRMTVDLSDDKSPGNKQSDGSWKGVYIHDYDLIYNSSTDQYSQITFQNEVVQQFRNEEALATMAWVDGEGLNLNLSKAFEGDSLTFNSFPGYAKAIEINIETNEFKMGQLTGGIRIPIFSETDFFDFTAPLSADGFRPGYLNDFDDRQFIFNKDKGEQEVRLSIKRAVFAQQRLLDITLDLHWPSIAIHAASVTGFKVWGDYQVGFYTPNGVRALDYQLEGSLSGYPVTFVGLAAGSNQGIYSFAITGKAQMGDDVSGDNGPPSINVYSLSPNRLLPKTGSTTVTKPVVADPIAYYQAEEAAYRQAGQEAGDNLATSEQEIKDIAQAKLADLSSQPRSTASLSDVVPGATSDVQPGSEALTAKPGGLLAKLNPRQREIVTEIVETLEQELTRSVTDSIKFESDRLRERWKARVDTLLNGVHAEVENKVTSLVNTIAKEIIKATSNGKVNTAESVLQLAKITIAAVSREVNNSVDASVYASILTPVDTFIQKSITGRVVTYVQDVSTVLIIDVLEGDINWQDVPSNLLQGADTVFSNMLRDAYTVINPEALLDMISQTAVNALRGISTDRIYQEIKAGAINALGDIVTNAVGQVLQEKLNAELGISIPIDFNTLNDKLKKGDIKGIFALDPVAIKLRSSVLELNGLIHYQNDNPVYGDVWLGDIDVIVKKPKRFTISATYINGKKDGYTYWFAQVSPADGGVVKLGDVIPRRARPLETPVSMGVAKIMGVSGRVYRHMKDGLDKPIVPDQSVSYGAYLNIILFDAQGDDPGKAMRLDVAGEYVMASDGDFTLDFDGNIQLMNRAPQVLEIDKNAAVQGIFRFSYNSKEEHFIGYGRIEIKKPQLCAAGSLLVDTKPGQWRIEIGSRNDRIIFIPGCAGWSPTGWLMMSEREVELGLGLQLSIYAETGEIDFAVVKVNVTLDAGIAAGVLAAIQYKPDFALLRAGIWVDLWADLSIHYKKPLGKWKTKTLLAIYAQGNLLVIFEPKPTTMEGTLKGRVNLLDLVNINFNTGFKKTLS